MIHSMSVNALLKRLEALRGEYVVVHDFLSSRSSDELVRDEMVFKSILKLDSFLLESEQLVVNIEKFVSKKDAKDPVSGENRFGPTMVKKMIHGYNDAELLRNDLVNTKAKYSEFKLKWEEATASIAVSNKTVVEETVLLSTDTDNSNSVDNSVFLSTEAANKLRVEAEKAKLLRESHKIELQLFVSSLNDSTQLPDYFINALNKLNSPIMNKYKVKKIFKNITDIVEGIVGHPDNVKLRRLKFSNPRLLEDITSFIGGIDVLVALGFRLELEDIDAAAQLLNPTPNADKGNSPEFDEVIFKMLQSLKVTNTEIILHMEEPDPLGDQWYPWFNGLKEKLETVCNYCARK